MRYHCVIMVKIADFQTCFEVSDKTGNIAAESYCDSKYHYHT